MCLSDKQASRQRGQLVVNCSCQILDFPSKILPPKEKNYGKDAERANQGSDHTDFKMTHSISSSSAFPAMLDFQSGE